MIQKNTISYLQRCTYRKNVGNIWLENIFEKLLRVTPTSEAELSEVFYNKELNINIKSNNSHRIYEIEAEKIRVKFDKQYYKLQDFYRRIDYRYDWLKVKVVSNGQVAVVDDLNELRANWIELKSMLKDEYIGVDAIDYMDKISNQFENDKHFQSLINNYFYLGLLFPPIPYQHSPDWNKERKVVVSEDSNIEFMESLVFEKVELDEKTYKITGSMITSEVELMRYEGQIILSDSYRQVIKSIVNIVYKNDVINKWTITLDHIANNKPKPLKS